jgi:hypothetical protein
VRTILLNCDRVLEPSEMPHICGIRAAECGKERQDPQPIRNHRQPPACRGSRFTVFVDLGAMVALRRGCLDADGSHRDRASADGASGGDAGGPGVPDTRDPIAR